MRDYLMMMALLASSLMAVPAEAAIYIITYTGTVSGSNDSAGLFGPAGASLDGDAFTAVYTLTDPKPGAMSEHGDIESITGGVNELGSASPLSATLTINGVTKYVGNYYGFVRQANEELYDNIFQDEIFHEVTSNYNAYNFGYSEIYNEIYGHQNIVETSNYTEPLHYTVKDGDTSSGFFELYDDTFSHYSSGSLTAQTVDILLAPASAVPEPATWLMMICGIGLTGVALRRRDATVRLAIA